MTNVVNRGQRGAVRLDRFGVRRVPDPQRGLPLAGVLTLDASTPVTHTYLMGESVGGPVLDFLADALGVVTGNRDTDYYLPLATLMPKAFDPMFVEHVWLTDATAADHPDLLDAQDRIRFDGVIPFEAVLDKQGMENESELLFKKWARNVRRGGDLRSARPNHQVLLSTAKHAIAPDEYMGLTEAGGGRNHTFLFVKSATSTNERREVLIHELTHQWRVNNGGQGHCDLTGRRQDRRMWDHSGLLCTMTSKLYPSLESTDGIVGFHYVKENGVVDSELTFVRQRPEPVPQNTP